MANEIIKAENLSKEYRLGEIGGRTLRADVQSFFARMAKKDDPNIKIGKRRHDKNEVFRALDDVSFSIESGQSVGIIGANGAGKSTLLKILSRISAPTGGKAYINGRISSMLEIGTGFHPELTGRENIYLNGAILGMSRREIDSKISDIIEFSECEKFIDTPIKRYSSGMYVKLAFAVAAHLDSEILIMDEVLAVGDMNFQKKCIEKMHSVSAQNGRTILYVSHNMDTVRNLCQRCILLEKGKISFDGDTEEAIARYLGTEENKRIYMSFSDDDIPKRLKTSGKRIIRLIDAEYTSGSSSFSDNERLFVKLRWHNIESTDKLGLRLTIYDKTMKSIASSVVFGFAGASADKKSEALLSFDISSLAEGSYNTRYTFFRLNGIKEDIESFMGLPFYKHTKNSIAAWRPSWGYVILPDGKCEQVN